MDPELADEWLYSSMKSYSSLYMYDLQQPITAGDWISEYGLCLAISDGKKNEVLELSLPDKLLSHQDNEGLLKDRDFRVETGGFLDHKIVQLSHIPKSKNVLASIEGENSVQILEIGGTESNLISQKLTIKNKKNSQEPAVFGISQKQNVIFGTKLSDLTVGDIETGITTALIHDVNIQDEGISAILSKDDNTYLVCGKSTGNLYTINIQNYKLTCIKEFPNISNGVKPHDSASRNESYWTMCMSCDQSTIYQMSNQGEIQMFDLKSSLTSKQKATLTGLSSDFTNIQMKCSPCGKYLSISGFDGNIYLFTTSQLQSESKVVALFTHEGHLANTDQSELITTVNLWHNNQSNLVLSGASDGSLHAWRPVFS